MEKPIFAEDGHFMYLDKLRESSETNMVGAIPYILTEFPELSRKEAKDVLTYWMKTYPDWGSEGGE